MFQIIRTRPRLKAAPKRDINPKAGCLIAGGSGAGAGPEMGGLDSMNAGR
jgi:hypothetical protein